MESKNKQENNSSEKIIFSPLSDHSDNKIELKPSIKQKLLALKNDIQIINHNSELFHKNFYENKKMTIFNKLRGSIERGYNRDINKSEADSSHIINNMKKGENVFITEKK